MKVDRRKLFEIFREEGGICPKCSHYKTCQKPCYPVQSYLNREMSFHTWEKTFKKSKGEMITITVGKKEIRETDLLDENKEGKRDKPDKLNVFSTENDNPFLSQAPDTRAKQTGIFIDRFFNKMKFEDLAVKYDLDSRGTAKNHYQEAVHRLLLLLELLEKEKGARLKLDLVKDKYRAMVGDLPKSHKYFLLNRLLDIEPETIAKLEEEKVQPSEIRKMIIRVNDGLRCGEICLFDATPREMRESKERLEAHRAAVRRHDRKKRAKIQSV